MRKIIYNQSMFDDKDLNKQILNLYDVILKTTKGLETDIYEVIDFSTKYYESNLFFPSVDIILQNYKTFQFIEEKFNNDKSFKFFIRDKHVFFRDILRREIAIDYLDTKNSIERRLEIIDKLASLEKEIIIDESDIQEVSSMNIKEIYENRKSLGEGPITNIEDIDNIIGGITAGKIMTVAAPPKCFKTTFAINLAYLGVTEYEKPNNTLFITLEISKDELLYKMLVRHSYGIKWGIPVKNILKGMLTSEEEQKLFELKKDFDKNKKSKIFFLGNEDLKISSVVMFTQQIVDMIQKNNLKTIILDYIQLFRNYRMRGYKDQYQLMNDIVGTLRFISVVYEVRIILLSQMNREGIKRGTRTEGYFTLPDLSEINELERSSYYVVTLYTNEDMKKAKQIKFQLLAHRDGETIEDPMNNFVLPNYFIVGKNKDCSFNSVMNLDESIINDASDNELLDFDFFEE